MVKNYDSRGDPRSLLFSRGAAEGKWNCPGITEGGVVLTIAQVKAVNICFITPQQTIYHLRTRNVRTRVAATQMHN